MKKNTHKEMKNIFEASFYEFRIPSLLFSVLKKSSVMETNNYSWNLLHILIHVNTRHQNADG